MNLWILEFNQKKQLFNFKNTEENSSKILGWKILHKSNNSEDLIKAYKKLNTKSSKKYTFKELYNKINNNGKK